MKSVLRSARFAHFYFSTINHPFMKFKKTLTRLFTVLPLGLLYWSAMAQGGQTLKIMQNGAELRPAAGNITVTSPNPLNLLVLDANPATVPNAPCNSELDQACGWYKGFWMFGDGNYLKFEDNVRTLDAASRNIPSYNYGRNGVYQPVVYLTEKYSNDEPPEAARATVVVNRTNPSGVITEPTRRLAGNPARKIDIDYNHAPRVEYPMNFVLSYRQGDPAEQVLFYYNAIQTGNALSTISPVSLMNYTASESAIYHTSAFVPSPYDNLPSGAGGPAPVYFGTILQGLNSKFNNLLSYNVRGPVGVFTENLTELRVFPVLTTKKLTDMPDGKIPVSPAIFLAIILGTDSLSTAEMTDLKLYNLATQLLGPNLPTNLRISPNSNLYIRGIQVMNLQVARSHDPNSLTVTAINDLGNGKFRVSFRMIICNEGVVAENNPSLTFNDLTGGKYAERPVFVAINGVTPEITPDGAPWKVNLPGFQISGTPTQYKPSCRSLLFTIDTDADGVQRLYQEDPRALEICVEFSEGAGDCSKNEPLLADEFKDANGKYPPLPDTGGGCADCDWWVWLLAVLAAFGIIIALRRRNNV
jgi:hypothetical protein